MLVVANSRPIMIKPLTWLEIQPASVVVSSSRYSLLDRSLIQHFNIKALYKKCSNKEDNVRDFDVDEFWDFEEII